ncbi:type II secretion system secretin GspD [Desulfatirhabdium butyrativorans]|uniref:type II secretion system secretin GspD n=1 Tax=Desulfatirhabdium butyrativorans TaxID=340467 RepID=UPI00146FBA7D|nr:type II secretion system secretin GspD [Desulfatirhabdium butyrativorans]
MKADRHLLFEWSPIRRLLCVIIVICVSSGCANFKGAGTGAGGEKPANPLVRIYSPEIYEQTPGAGGETGASAATGAEAQTRPAAPAQQEQPAGPKVPGESPFAKFGQMQGKAPAEFGKKTRPEPEKPIHLELAFDNADLYEVLDLTLYEHYGVSYMIDPSIKAQVTFHVSGDYTKTQFIDILNNILQLSNLAVVRGPGNIFKIVQRAASAGAGNEALNADKTTEPPGDITRMIRLRYIGAPMAAASLTPFLSRGAVIIQDNVNNALLMTDTADNLDKAAAILGVMDVPFFEDVSWRVFPVKAVDVDDLAKDLGQVLKSAGLFSRPGATQGSFEIVPIRTMNALLVVTRWPALLTLVDDWITAMDRASNTGTQVWVYFAENGNAAELADIIGQLYGSTARSRSTSTSSSRSGRSGTSTSLSSSSRSGTSSSSRRRSTNTRASSAAPQAATLVGGTGDILGDVEIIADEANNAIVVRATERDYRIIEKVLKQLDILPRQVLINVVIAEVTLTGSVEWGLEWFLNKNIGAIGSDSGEYTFQGALDNGIKRSVNTPLGSSSGFFFSIYDPVDFLRGLGKVLGSDSGINILSSPNILALDNKEASIEVGKEIPTVTGTTTDATAGTTITNSVQYRKTGIILNVTPHINSSGLVKMELEQEVSDVGEFITELKNYTFLSRRADTSLVVEDGKTIVIGGLMKSNRQDSNAGIPLLKDIPVLGYLFGAGSKKSEKTELIILITPNVVKSRAEADRITREFSGKIEHLTKELQ